MSLIAGDYVALSLLLPQPIIVIAILLALEVQLLLGFCLELLEDLVLLIDVVLYDIFQLGKVYVVFG